MEKRFTTNKYYIYDHFKDNRWLVNEVEAEEIVEIMNNLDMKARERSKALSKLQKENEELKQQNQEYQAILQDMGILLTDNEVINLRNEIADKLLKPMFKSNGFDVDIDTTDGFTIIPKGDVE